MASNNSMKLTGSISPKTRKTPQNTMVISLPSGASGERLRKSLNSIARKESRSLSNMISVILSEYVENIKNGHR